MRCFDKLDHRALLLRNGNANLLSLDKIVDEGPEPGYTFHGDRHTLQVLDAEGEADRNQKGFWEFDCSPLSEVYFRRAAVDRHFTREQIARARLARDIHCTSGHPSDSSLVISLINGSLLGTHITSTDVRNAKAIFGPCEACLVGKRRHHSVHSSDSPPATRPGQHLFGDIIPYDGVSITGNRGTFLCVCEFIGLLTGIPLKSKNKASIVSAMKQTIAIYNAYGFRVEVITTDAERCLQSAKDHVAEKGIRLTSTIPYEHQKRIERYVATINAARRTIRA